MRALRFSAIFVVLAAFGTACSKKGDDKSTKKPPADPIKVGLVEAVEAKTPNQIVLTGVIIADQRAEVTADTQGKVISVMVERGKPVKQGDSVIQLDVQTAALGAREAQANLASARAQRELAEEECKRTKALLEKGAITRSEYDRQIAQCTSALQQVSAAEARTAMMAKSVRDGMVRAPFDGIVAQRMVTPGEWVAPGRALFTLVDNDPLRIELSVPEIAVSAVKEGQPVTLVSVSQPGKMYSAKITRVGAEIGRTRSLIVEATIDPTSDLLPGMFAEAHLTIANDVVRPVIPSSAVVKRCWNTGPEGSGSGSAGPAAGSGGSGSAVVSTTIYRSLETSELERRKCGQTWHVFVAKKGELVDRIVQLGPPAGPGKISIVQGVAAGDRVVVKVDSTIADGMRVVE